MKLKTINLFLFLITGFLLAQYLRLDLKRVASLTSEAEVDLSFLNLNVFGLFLFSVFFIFLNKRQRLREEASFMRNLMICVYVISILHSFKNPFATKLLNITIILPYLLFVFTYISANVIKRRVLYGFILSLFLYLVYSYSQEFTKVLASSLSEQTSQTNASYFILYLLPLVLCLDKKWIQYTAFLIAIIVTLSSAKRSGTIAVLLGLLIYSAVDLYRQKSNIHKRPNVLWIVAAIMLISFFIFNPDFVQELTVVNRLKELEEDGGSGRTDIYRHTFSMICNSDVLSLLFGHGWDRVVRDSKLGLSAHNDFLEVMYDFGIIGIIMYLLFFYYLIKKTFLLIKKRSEYAASIAVSLVLFSLNSFSSHIIIYPGYMSIFAICWGYILSQDYKQIEKETADFSCFDKTKTGTVVFS